MNPFPLSSSDYSDFMNEIGPGLSNLPSWGGVIQWRRRYILAFLDAVGNWRLTDITGGIPVNGEMLPASVLVQDLPTTELGPVGAFLYSLPGNLYAVAVERLQQLKAAGVAVGQAVGETAGDIIAPLATSLTPALGPLALIAVAVLAFMYLPKSSAK